MFMFGGHGHGGAALGFLFLIAAVLGVVVLACALGKSESK